MIVVERVCEQCGQLARMEVQSQSSTRRFCDECRRKRAVQATLRSRSRKKPRVGVRTEIHRVKFTYSAKGALIGMEVLT